MAASHLDGTTILCYRMAKPRSLNLPVSAGILARPSWIGRGDAGIVPSPWPGCGTWRSLRVMYSKRMRLKPFNRTNMYLRSEKWFHGRAAAFLFLCDVDIYYASLNQNHNVQTGRLSNITNSLITTPAFLNHPHTPERQTDPPSSIHHPPRDQIRAPGPNSMLPTQPRLTTHNN